MPIRPENKDKYPKNWKSEIRPRILKRAKNRCEFPGCRVENYKPHPKTGSKVVLTIAHLDHNPENCEDDNLAALCQRCHNRFDMRVRTLGKYNRAYREQIKELEERIKQEQEANVSLCDESRDNFQDLQKAEARIEELKESLRVGKDLSELHHSKQVEAEAKITAQEEKIKEFRDVLNAIRLDVAWSGGYLNDYLRKRILEALSNLTKEKTNKPRTTSK